MVQTSDDIAKLILRLFTGFILILHGINKMLAGMPYVFDSLKAIGLPGFIGYGVFLGEFLGPVLILIGWKSRIGGLLIAANMLASVLLMHRAQVFQLNDYGAWVIELNAMLFMSGLAIFFAGAGKYSLSHGIGKWD